MENQLKMVGRRIREARTAADVSVKEMAMLQDMSEEEYLKHESGETDSSITFLFRCAERFNMDLSALITGETPHLSFYSLIRKGSGTPIKRREGLVYQHMAINFKHRCSDPLYVTAPFHSEDEPIHLSTHEGQEFDFVLKGTLKCQFEDKVEYLEEGDSVYYDSGHLHGMVASGGSDCVFLAIVMHSEGMAPEIHSEKPQVASTVHAAEHKMLYQNYVEEFLDENGYVKNVKFHVPDNFNFAYDVVDAIAEKSPDKLAMRWLSGKHELRDFSFREISEGSQKTANYLTALGIRKGDRVMLVLKRHYQFWLAITALHRIGAVAVPATNQLLTKDFVYRFQSAGIKAVLCTADDHVADYADEAAATCPTVAIKILVNGQREGWHDFNTEVELYSSVFKRPADHKVTDPMLMYFSSGTSGYPKMVLHNYSYPVGHIGTARWWQNTDPNGLHFTISDSGWAKCAWGKIYGQWFCESAIFVYDFHKFDSADILPLFKRYKITSFCAPPTMYRFFIKDDLSKYDFSTVKHAATAGEALNAEVYQQFYQATGLRIMEAFGQTETTAILGTFTGTEPRPGSMGKVSPQYPVVLVDADDKPVENGQIGEIAIRMKVNEFPGIIQEYYNDPEKTAESWRNGYYHTGDTAWRDEDGYFWYVGRVDDVIKSSGYRIGPFEIESVLMELPYVLECAVTGAPDPVRGQVVKATIVLTKGQVGSEELKKEIQNYVKTHTAPYKYPRIVEFVAELPKTPSGKIRRKALREASANAAKPEQK